MSKHTNRLNSLWPHTATDAESSALPDVTRLAEKVEPLVQNVGSAIAEHPRVSLTLAASLGVALGWFIKRK